MAPFRILISLLSVLCVSVGSAQDRGPSDSELIVIPFQYVQGHVLLRLEDPTTGPLNLLLDTGWERTAISTRFEPAVTTQGSIWKQTTRSRGFGGDESKQPYRLTELNLTFNGHQVFNGKALLQQLDHFANSLQQPIDGVLGWDVISKWCTRINYRSHTVTLLDPARCGPVANSSTAVLGDWSKHGMLIPIAITFANGHMSHVLARLDTGADASILLSPKFREVSGLPQNRMLPESGENTGVGVNGTFAYDFVPIRLIQIADGVQLSEGRVMVSRPDTRGHSLSKSKQDGIIGNGILANFILTMDPARQRVYMELALPESR